MAVYSNVYRERAIKEFSESLTWYKQRSFQAAENFKLILENTITAKENPYQFKKSYKRFYIVKIKKFPFSIVYFIEEVNQLIVIATIFHNKRNSTKSLDNNQ